jgi:hypothetical protein
MTFDIAADFDDWVEKRQIHKYISNESVVFSTNYCYLKIGVQWAETLFFSLHVWKMFCR